MKFLFRSFSSGILSSLKHAIFDLWAEIYPPKTKNLKSFKFLNSFKISSHTNVELNPVQYVSQCFKDKLEILKNADHIFIEQIRKYGLYDKIWQAFVAILPVKTVGVMGDKRTYDFACTLRAVTSVDGMTADYYPFEHEFLRETSTRIINEVKGINRVTYDITSKPPGTIEWE